MLVVSLGVLARLKLVGISDKYIQQEEPDQELAFQKAFTLEVLITAAAIVPMLAARCRSSRSSTATGRCAPPGLVLITVLAADALQARCGSTTGEWTSCASVRSGVEPVVGFVVAIVLARSGSATGRWRSAWSRAPGRGRSWRSAARPSPCAGATTAARSRLRRVLGPDLPRHRLHVVLANGAAIAINAHLGLAGVGAVALAAQHHGFTDRVDDLVSGTLYPAICAMQDRMDLLRESFVKSNRLALMWAMPFGVGAGAVHARSRPLRDRPQWDPAIVLLQVTGVVAAINQIGFNWDDYFRARADTRPLAVASVVSTVVLLAVGIPLLLAHGLTGLGIGIAAGAGADLALRVWYLARLFHGWRFVRHALRAIIPTVPAATVVLAARAVESGPRTVLAAVLELALYVAVAVAATWRVEGGLVHEAVGYLRGADGDA